MAELLRITVWRSTAARSVQEHMLELPAPATVADALAAAGWAQPGNPSAGCGIWGRACASNSPLRDGDRVELYRSLTVDPKVARRERFAQQGARGAGLFAARRPHSKSGY